MIARESERSAPARGAAPLVTVIIPVYQGEKIVTGAVRSALAQTHRNLEVLVVDDGSTDGTRERLAAIDDPRVTVFSQPNRGTAAARNFALEHARGEYIAFLDSDDRWLPTKLEIEIAALRAAASPIAVAYSSFYAVDDGGRLLHVAPARNASGNVLDDLLDGDDFLMPSLCLFDRRIFADVGHFNIGRYHEDHEFILRVARRYPVVATGKHLAIYRQSTSGKCRAILSDFDRARFEELCLLDDLANTFSPDQLARLRENVVRALYCRFLMYGFGRSARRLAKEVDLSSLASSKKGALAWVFAKTGINLLVVARSIVQGYYRLARQTWWTRRLAADGMELGYD